jgi:hypothetical protein
MTKRKRKTKMDKDFDRIMELFFPMFDQAMKENLDPITMLYAISQFVFAVFADNDTEPMHDAVNDAFWRMYDAAMKAGEAPAKADPPMPTVAPTLTKH